MQSSAPPRLTLPGLALAFAAGLAAAAEDGEYLSRSSPPFEFRYPEPFQADVLRLEARGREVLPVLAADLGSPLPPRIDVTILPARAPVREGGSAPEWAAGWVPEGAASIVIVRDRLGSYPSLEMEGVFLHELTHVLINELLGDRSWEVPRWFDEGVAMLQSRRWGFRDALEMTEAFFGGTDLPLETISRGFPEREGRAQAAYAESFAFLGYLVRRHGPDLPRRILAAVRDGAAFNAAFRETTGQDLWRAEEEWRESMVWKYRWIPILTSNGLLFSSMGLLFVVSYWRKQRQARRTLEAWDRYEPPEFH